VLTKLVTRKTKGGQTEGDKDPGQTEAEEQSTKKLERNGARVCSFLEKKSENFLDADNVILYQRVKSQLEMPALKDLQFVMFTTLI
jgi:hypothetical protein